MGPIKRLKLRVSHLGSPKVTRTVHLLEKLDETKFRVHWGSTPQDNGLASPAYLEMCDWKPLTLELSFYSRAGSKILYFHKNESAATTWKKITPFVLRKCYAEARSSQLADEDTYPGGYRDSNDEGGKYKYTRGHKFYHSAIGEVIDKYTDSWNAVRIEPNSWLDNRLQEAYYSRRQRSDESKTHE